jgi:hypothetical protein
MNKPASQETAHSANETHDGKYLTAYLNDHLTGAATVINLLHDLERTYRGKAMEPFLVKLRGDIIADRLTLEGVMQRSHVEKRTSRTFTTWLIEKLSRRKLRMHDKKDGPLHLLEALEFVEVGIEGKRELWRSLAATGERSLSSEAPDFEQLIQRAREQHDRVENVRLETAKLALAAG